MANLEIERKFLLKSLPKVEPKDSIKIEQLYLKKNGIWERLRSWESESTGKKKWIHTVKTSLGKGVNLEDEYTVSEEEFNLFKKECFNSNLESKMIFKTRHIYPNPNSKLYWEVDEFHNDYKLIVAEIEIPQKDFKIDIPKWISDLILLEVTGLKQFSNRSLSLKIR
jgi:CYTH domain-containing protein